MPILLVYSTRTQQDPIKCRRSTNKPVSSVSTFQERRCLQDFLKENERKVNLKDADVVLMRRRMPTLEKAKKKSQAIKRERMHHLLLKIKHGLKGITSFFLFLQQDYFIINEENMENIPTHPLLSNHFGSSSKRTVERHRWKGCRNV